MGWKIISGTFYAVWAGILVYLLWTTVHPVIIDGRIRLLWLDREPKIGGQVGVRWPDGRTQIAWVGALPYQLLYIEDGTIIEFPDLRPRRLQILWSCLAHEPGMIEIPEGMLYLFWDGPGPDRRGCLVPSENILGVLTGKKCT